MKRPEAAAFIREVMARMGAENPSDLCRRMGGDWFTPNRVRLMYDWHNGEAAPSFRYTFGMLSAAGLIRASGEAGAAGAPPADPVTARLESLGADLAEVVRDQALILQLLGERVGNGELPGAQPSRTPAPPKRKRKSA